MTRNNYLFRGTHRTNHWDTGNSRKIVWCWLQPDPDNKIKLCTWSTSQLSTLIHSTNKSLFFFRRRNCPRTTYALSNPLLSNLLPKTSPIPVTCHMFIFMYNQTSEYNPARSVTAFSPIGSATKFLCFCEVVDIVLRYLLSCVWNIMKQVKILCQWQWHGANLCRSWFMT